MKTCTGCKQTKGLALYYKDKSTKDGHTRRCMSCLTNTRQQNLQYMVDYMRYKRENNREEVNEYNRKRHRELEPRKRMLWQARNRAKMYGIDFNIELEDIILPVKCPVLDIEFVKGTKGDYQRTYSLDRIDNSKGYIKGNIWVISCLANTMKSSASIEQLLTFCSNILSNDDIVRTLGKPKEVEDKELLR